MTEDKYPSL